MKKLTNDEFLLMLKEKHGDDIISLEKYQNKRTKIKFLHSKCNKEFDMRPDSILRGQTCPHCRYLKSADSKISTYKLIFEQSLNKDYEIISEYLGSKKNIKLLHKKCGTEFITTPSSALSKTFICPTCRKEHVSKKRSFSNDKFLEIFNESSSEEYELMNSYKNKRTMIEVRHRECGNVFKVRPQDFINNKSRCPYCRANKGEKEIRNLLMNNSISFEEQYSFEDCKNKNKLRFDFAILKDNKVILLIEYQGEQHYTPVSFFGGKVGFQKRQHNDQIKREYCILKNIKLLEIPYTEFNNIEQILKENNII